MISGRCSPLRRLPGSLILPLLHMSINVDPSVKLCINLFLVFNSLFKHLLTETVILGATSGETTEFRVKSLIKSSHEYECWSSHRCHHVMPPGYNPFVYHLWNREVNTSSK